MEVFAVSPSEADARGGFDIAVDTSKRNVAINPFGQLRPAPRSEEDDIRMGIFGHLVRLLHASGDEDRARWRKAVEEAQESRLSAMRAGRKAKLNQQVHQLHCKDEQEKANNEVQSESVADIREDVEKKSLASLSQVSEAVKRPRTDTESCPDSARLLPGGQAIEQQTAAGNGGVGKQEDQTTSDVEFISAYLRTLLEKVIGLSLLELKVDALRVLCIMLSIPLPNSKSKMTYYSKLASFYYTNCEKLGKRVSTSYYLEEQYRRDEEMRRKIFTTAEPTPAEGAALSKGRATYERGIVKSSKSAAGSSGLGDHSTARSARERQHLSVADSNSTLHTTRVTRSDCKATVVPVIPRNSRRKSDERVQALEVVHHGKVFAAPSTRGGHPAPVGRSAEAVEASEGEEQGSDNTEEWSALKLERKVASVVHLYDPVTTSIVVNKLAQMGYRSPSATETVERILRSFHERQFIFYDNGIAYLL
ncbi:hypothetical protein ERJ75_001443600 [Trypanosoma vivax]|uniref:Uncharacterized protein n=1 Tax=Trypanosoma vivax (strain Y486) TaxID=1055687 RepID=G0U865_TRYVY|nr:hypothetical protein ERJ75_001443600 [Trypanosoma vivax]CCC52074.1 conserved hypothetical protein [Trypanosoma vivax Y486]